MTSDLHKRRTNDYQFTNPLANSPVAVIQPLEKQRSSKEISEDFCNRLDKSVKKIVNTSLIEKSNIDTGHLCTHKGMTNHINECQVYKIVCAPSTVLLWGIT